MTILCDLFKTTFLYNVQTIHVKNINKKFRTAPHSNNPCGHGNILGSQGNIPSGHDNILGGHGNIPGGHGNIPEGHNNIPEGPVNISDDHSSTQSDHNNIQGGHGNFSSGLGHDMFLSPPHGQRNIPSGHGNITGSYGNTPNGHGNISGGHGNTIDSLHDSIYPSQPRQDNKSVGLGNMPDWHMAGSHGNNTDRNVSSPLTALQNNSVAMSDWHHNNKAGKMTSDTLLQSNQYWIRKCTISRCKYICLKLFVQDNIKMF